MGHPFFDSVTYPWHRPEAVRLHRALYEAIRVPGLIDTEYQKCANEQHNLPPLTLGLRADLMWKEALENLTVYTGGLQKLCSQRFINVELQSAAAAVVNARPFTELRIAKEDMIFIDREKLRKKIDLVVPDTGIKKVLLVRGGAQSGKSYGRHLLHGAALDRGALFVYIYSGIAVNIQSVIARLFTALGALDEVPPVFTTDIAGYLNVCNKLQDVAMRKNRQLWIAVDDLGVDADGVPLLSAEIKEFFDQFALLLPDPSFSAWFRLMLIHYPDGKLPTKWRREILDEDQPKEEDVQAEHVAEVIREWSAANGVAIVEADLLALAAEVIANAEAPLGPDEEPASRLQRINEELSEKLNELAGQKP